MIGSTLVPIATAAALADSPRGRALLVTENGCSEDEVYHPIKEFSHLPFSVKNWVRMAEGPEKDRVIKDVQRLYNCCLYKEDKKQIYDFSEYELPKCTVFNICDDNETECSRPKKGV
jgi:hypothetical protein